MQYDPKRHEPLRRMAWNEGIAMAAITHIAKDAEARYSEQHYWPLHPADRQGDSDVRTFESALYDGACGVFWALDYLQAVGAIHPARGCSLDFPELLDRNRTLLGSALERDRASFLLGDTSIYLLAFSRNPSEELETALDSLIAGNIDHPAHDLMMGAPGTMLAALLLHEHTGKHRWADLFRITAGRLWEQLEWSEPYQCFYWQQQFERHPSTYLDAIHGFAGVALPLIRGRHLLDSGTWDAWEARITRTVRCTVDRDGAEANWRPQLVRTPDADKKLLQLCHGAPGFVVCLSGLPGSTLEDLLLAAGETIWSAGPLLKGSNLCHGTAGNGFAFLKLYQRTRNPLWLQRARAFAMHGIMQAQEEVALVGQGRYSLWTGDLGLAIFLWNCITGEANFPTLDVFMG